MSTGNIEILHERYGPDKVEIEMAALGLGQIIKRQREGWAYICG
jgi:hypothetical protein